MNPDETFPIIAHERQQIGFLRVVHVEITIGEEYHRVEVVEVFRPILQRFLGDRRAVRAEVRVPFPGVSAEELLPRRLTQEHLEKKPQKALRDTPNPYRRLAARTV